MEMKQMLVKVLENFSINGDRYSKGQIMPMEEKQAKKLAGENLVEDFIVTLGVNLKTEVDKTKYVAIKEHEDVKVKLKEKEEKIIKLEKAVENLTKDLAKANETKEEIVIDEKKTKK